MSPIYLSVALGLLRTMPQVAQDIEQAVKAAESPEEAKSKVKEVLADAAKVISTIVEAL